ncbi:hydroxyphenylacetyl-CoA thioesterase PaaI [Streptomyces sp. NB004]|uniref:Hydroxyphenylacetyl-CoA thioesterase PaaI n=1 Tax=Streptomyces parvulus TaxID=146923 RepID=A0ABV5D7C7_9ACTN|nr:MULTISPECIES: hydroxyphenylacetyl-CoA thioesterase PaaI [Streptomyces]MCQ4195542.1 hydroxyphenylacetyl-CoA thioesterase PaaI [Streptomyces parvulus]WML78559.1 hydroxyphenylacetyl-CoA thioesterase PaaI [Streptomyces sp. VNUA74]
MSQAAGPTPTETMFSADEASRGLGIELVEHGEGTALLRMTVTPAMVNGHRIAHGGYVFLLADSAFACACNSHGPVTVAAGADIVFVAPAREGDVLVARAEERARFGRSGVYDVSVRRGDELIAEFRGRSRSVREGAAGGTPHVPPGPTEPTEPTEPTKESR